MDKKNFNDVLSRTNLAFNRSVTKGIIFWYNVLLPDSEANTKANEQAWKNLKNTFAKQKPKQLNLIEKVIADFQYIRTQVLKSKSDRKKVEELKKFLMQSIASEEVVDSLQGYVHDNYNKIKLELENKK
jgi:3-methyladenine DNA glycosylase AlkD